MKLFGKKKVLDERERMDMYRRGYYGFWVLWTAMAIGLVVRTALLEAAFLDFAWEWTVFMAVSIWMVAADLKSGVYDRFTEPGWKSYLFYSLVFSVVFTAVSLGGGVYRGWITTIRSACIAGLVEFAFLFLLLYVILAAYGVAARRRRRKLEEEFDDEE